MQDATFNKTYARLGFRCRCELCLVECVPLTKKLGKFWQAMYGESINAFKKRFYTWHKARCLTQQKKVLHVQTASGGVIKMR